MKYTFWRIQHQLKSHFGVMTHLTDPNGGPWGQKFLGLGAPEPQKPPKFTFFFYH